MSKRKVVLVTGSTSGIGLGIAKEFALNGYDIGLNGLGDAAVVEAIKRDIEVNFGAQVFYSDADMAKPNEIERFVKGANDALGAIDVLINNAGVQHVSPVEHFPTDKWDLILAV
ncbi:MAG: SDR family NAD(P)-dependent oxidoreductase, partial [Betaproteobacteria bacterium]|nr:SDR family NAD(P)-dependent oxidoreductase [Betaproteobacteria bacterium]